MNKALQWKLIAGFILTFLAGGATGFFASTAHIRNLFVLGEQPGPMAMHMKERLRNQLDLTPEQMAKAAPIIERMTGDLQQVRVETGRRVHQTITKSHEEIAVFLTDDQKAKLKQMEQRQRRWRMMRRHGPGPRGHGGPPPPAERRPPGEDPPPPPGEPPPEP